LERPQYTSESYIIGGHGLIGNATTGQPVDSIQKYSISKSIFEEVSKITLPVRLRGRIALWDDTGFVHFGGKYPKLKKNTFTDSATSQILRYLPGWSTTSPGGELPFANSHSSIATVSRNPLVAYIFGEEMGNRIVKFSKNFASELTDQRLPIQISGAASVSTLDCSECVQIKISCAYLVDWTVIIKDCPLL
jgi:hypothetical protein